MINTTNQDHFFFLESQFLNVYQHVTAYMLHSPDSRGPSLVRKKNSQSTVLKAKLLSFFSCINVPVSYPIIDTQKGQSPSRNTLLPTQWVISLPYNLYKSSQNYIRATQPNISIRCSGRSGKKEGSVISLHL